MKTYVFISDEKVQRLLPQIPATLQSAPSGSDNRVGRLEAVVNYIKEWGGVGTVLEPDLYIQDRMKMQFQVLDAGRHDPTKGLAYWTSEQLHTVVGLGGSVRYLMDAPKYPSPSWSTPSLAVGIRTVLRMEENNQNLTGAEPEYRTALECVSCIYELIKEEKISSGTFSFMAKKLIHQSSGGKTVLFASPLYVAKED